MTPNCRFRIHSAPQPVNASAAFSVEQLRATSLQRETRNILPSKAKKVNCYFQSTVESTLVPFGYDSTGKRDCCTFTDPLIYSGHPAKFLVLDMEYGQNVRYFEDHLHKLREMFTFNNKLKDRGEKILNRLKINNVTAMCVHIRRTDFILFGAESSFQETLDAVLQIATSHRLEQYIVFGDDQVFIKNLAGNITQYNNGSHVEAYASHFNEFEDFFVSSRACAAFLMSAPTSTFGWWLAFFAPNQEAVYYINNGRALMQKKPNRDIFLSWALCALLDHTFGASAITAVVCYQPAD
ncbi:hypothetical protein Y032_0305g1942 [Ancylostoma ceylanicum]|uniref:L-Fucosyltransferase n=1 Tax=Ancylostoma ceylanicum TaxID=53326 RepID=A0A016S4B6_9BILA|nr:hypothetical protein Y032_0305g1942 [Ancylostoma ceylanicum]